MENAPDDKSNALMCLLLLRFPSAVVHDVHNTQYNTRTLLSRYYCYTQNASGKTTYNRVLDRDCYSIRTIFDIKRRTKHDPNERRTTWAQLTV